MRRSLEVGRGIVRKPVYPEPAQPRRGHAHKNTKRWCRGKVGVEHLTAWIPDKRFGSWWNLECVSCHRLLAWCAGLGACRCGNHVLEPDR